MPQKIWADQFEKIIRAHVPGLAEEDTLDPHAALFDLGLDSLGMIGLLVELEEEFGVTFPQDDLGVETFASPQALWDVITRWAD